MREAKHFSRTSSRCKRSDTVERSSHLVLIGGGEAVVEHFLVENRRDASWHGRHNPHPVAGAAASHPVLVLHVLHEGLGGRVMVHYGHFACLEKEKLHNWTNLNNINHGFSFVLLQYWYCLQVHVQQLAKCTQEKWRTRPCKPTFLSKWISFSFHANFNGKGSRTKTYVPELSLRRQQFRISWLQKSS